MKSLSSKTYQCGVTIEGLTTLAGITYLTGITNTTSWDHVIVGTTAQGQIYTRTYAQFMTDVATGIGLSGYVPTSRTLSINGTTYDLSANRSWTISTVDYTSRLQHQVKAGVAINKGQAVYVTSADGTNMIVGLASNASEATSSKTMGLLDATVTTNGFANVVTEGLLAGLDTSTAGSEGDPVWLGTGGNLIYGLANKPYAPAHLVFIGIVTRKNNSNGEIFVKVQNGFELNEIHDVDLKTNVPVNGELLGFNGTLWVNKTIAGWLGYTPANASGTTNYLSKFTGSTTLGNSLVYDNGTNVGIGTNAPSYKLHVAGTTLIQNTSNTTLYINETGGNVGDVANLYLVGNNMGWGASLRYNVGAGGANNRLDFYTGTSNRMSIAADTGNLLINTITDSGYKLDVNGTARINSSLYVSDPAYTGSGRFYQAANATTIISGGPAGENITFGPSNRIFINASQTRFINGSVQMVGTLSLGNGSAIGNHMLWVTGSITASSTVGKAIGIDTTLVAAANNDVLVGLDIAPTFTNGAFTGVTNYAIRTVGVSVFRGPSTSSVLGSNLLTSAAAVFYANTYNGVVGIGSYSNGGGEIQSAQNGGVTLGGSLILQRQAGIVLIGTATDAGYKLDVNGSTRVKGTGTTSATTAFMVENSGATIKMFKANDDGAAYVGWDSTGDYNSVFLSNGNVTIGRYGNALTYTKSVNTVSLANQTWKFTPTNFYWGTSPNESSLLPDGTLSLGSYTAVVSAMLSMTSTTKGFLPPRMTNAQAVAISTPATGLQVYDTTNNKNLLYDGTAWRNIATENWVTSQAYVPQARTLTINGTTYDLSANRSWTIATTTPGGSNTQFQYNSSGTLAGASALTYDSGTNRVGINQASPGYDLDVNGQVRVQDKLRVGNVNSGNGVVHMSSTATINPSATTIVWSQNVSVGMCAFIEYYILNNNTTTDQRAGTIMVTWNQSGTPTIAHTETTTPDIGSTIAVNFTSSLVGSDARINAVNSSAAPYTIVMSYKYF